MYIDCLDINSRRLTLLRLWLCKRLYNTNNQNVFNYLLKYLNQLILLYKFCKGLTPRGIAWVRYYRLDLYLRQAYTFKIGNFLIKKERGYEIKFWFRIPALQGWLEKVIQELETNSFRYQTATVQSIRKTNMLVFLNWE